MYKKEVFSDFFLEKMKQALTNNCIYLHSSTGRTYPSSFDAFCVRYEVVLTVHNGARTCNLHISQGGKYPLQRLHIKTIRVYALLSQLNINGWTFSAV